MRKTCFYGLTALVCALLLLAGGRALIVCEAPEAPLPPPVAHAAYLRAALPPAEAPAQLPQREEGAAREQALPVADGAPCPDAPPSDANGLPLRTGGFLRTAFFAVHRLTECG